MGFEIRPISAEELPAFHGAMGVPFGFDSKPEQLERFRNTFELERLRAAFDGGQIVATFGAFSYRMAVPGGSTPMAGTTVVSVSPTHRRQGILRAFMADHFTELYEHRSRDGESLAALWASESSIYGRFGYGPASELARVKLEKPHAAMAEPVSIQGTMRLLDRNEALAEFPKVYEQIVASRPGTFLRSARWWEHRVLSDPEDSRDGATAHRRVLHVREGEPAGYVLYRTKANRERHTNQVIVMELLGIDAAAEKALWQYLFGLDLVTSIEYWNQPVDAPLHWWLVQPRRLERSILDGLWVRLVDVPAALAARTYSSPGSIVLKVTDPHCAWNAGTFQLDVADDGRADCKRTQKGADIEVSAYGLGAVYLGGHRLRDLARAGVLTGDPDALCRGDRMFTWQRPPWCQEVF
jgi:predicted acetyltransferase